MSHLQTPVTRQQQKERDADESKKPVVFQNKQEKIEAADSTPSPASVSKIRTRLSTGTLFMNGTSTFKEKDIKLSPTLCSSKSPKDGATPGVKRKNSTSVASAEAVISLPPKRRKIGQNDGSGEGNKNDYFCWLCHKDECNAFCRVCPRIYHLKCLGVSSLPKEWVCPECEKIMRAECVDTRSKAMARISVDTLCLLLRYALERMQQPGSEVFLKPVDESAFPSYRDYIFNPMDFVTLEKNIKDRQYGCTEAFLADARWILHNCIVFNGLHHKMTNIARNIIKSCKHEMSEIEVCPECYQNSCLKNDGNWFVEPCHPPHTLVWAKLKGYPFWPAKALREVNGQVDVRFFGAHDRSWVVASQVFLLSRDSPAPIKNRKGGFAGAMKEVEVHIKKIKEEFGGFEYAPKNATYSQRHLFMKYNMKGMKAAHRFKVASRTKSSRMEVVNTDRASMASKAASALISKYNSLSSRKSTLAAAQSRTMLARTKTKPPLSVTDIIEEKIKQQKQLEDEEEKEEGENKVEEEKSSRNQSDGGGVDGERSGVSEEKTCVVSGRTVSSGSDNVVRDSEEMSGENRVLSEKTSNKVDAQKVGTELLSGACGAAADVEGAKNGSSTSGSLDSSNASVSDESTQAQSLSSFKGVDYRNALTKVIETCKDKLGIKNVEELEEHIDLSDGDEDGERSEEIRLIDGEDEKNESENRSPSECSADAAARLQSTPGGSLEPAAEKRPPSTCSVENSDNGSNFTSVKLRAETRIAEGKETAQAQQPEASKTAKEKSVPDQLERSVHVVDMVCENAAGNKEVACKGSGGAEGVGTLSRAVPVPKPANGADKTNAGINSTTIRCADTDIKPITIDDESGDEKDNGNEPGLLMEVESEPEPELENDQLIIDLEEDDLELREDKNMRKNAQTSEKSKSDNIVRELSPSPMVKKNIQEERMRLCQKEKSLQNKNSNTSLPSGSPQVLSKASAPGWKPLRESSCGPGLQTQKPPKEASIPILPTTETVVSQGQSSVSKSTAVAKSSSSISLQESSSHQPDETALTPAAVRLVNQYSSQLMGNLQQQLAQMCKEVITIAVPEQEKSRCYQQETERLKWIHQQEIAEIKHSYKLSVAEMRTLWETEKSKSLADLKKKLSKEKEEAVVAAKKKQWCANCLKEAIYYCCWNTSYCSYECQQAHWPSHLPSCMQTQSTTTSASTTPVSASKSTNLHTLNPISAKSSFDSDVLVMSASLVPSKAKGVDNTDKLQKFNLTPPQSTASMIVQGNEPWRSHVSVSHAPVGQNLHFLPASQAVPSGPPYISNSPAPQPPPLPPPSQPLQQLHYLQRLGVVATNPRVTCASQVQLLSSQPGVSNILPSATVMPTSTVVLPILHSTQQSGTQSSNQNILISRPIRFQSVWK